MGFLNVVPPGPPLFGRKIVLKPVPPNSPVKAERTPRGGPGVVVLGRTLTCRLSAAWMLNPDGW